MRPGPKIRKRSRFSAIQRANSQVRYAIIHGTLKKEPCQECGDLNSRAHHDNPSKPLEVAWLCQSCHIYRHHELGWGYR